MYQQNQPDPFHQVINFNGQVPPAPNVPNANLVAPNELGNIHAGLVNGLASKAQRGHPLRIYMLNVMAHASFQNNEYCAMLDGAIEFYAYLRQTGNQPQQAAAITVDMIVNVEMVAFVNNHQECQQFIDNAAANDLNKYAQQFEEIRNALRQFDQQQQQMQFNNQGGGQFPNHGGWPGNQNNMMGYQTNQMNNMNQQYNRGWQGNNMGMNNGPMNSGGMNRPRPGRYGNNANMLNAGRSQAQPSNMTSSMERPRSGRFSNTNLDPTPDHRPNDNGAMFDTSNVQQSKGARSKYLDQNRQQDNHNEGDVDMHTYDDTTRQISAQQRRLEAEETMGNLPDPLKEEYHRRLPAIPRSHRVVAKDGQFVVVEGNNMDYADHETDPKMVELSKNHTIQPKVVEDTSRWPLMSRPDVVDVDGEHKEEDIQETESIIYDGPVKASSISEAVSSCYIGLVAELGGDTKVDPKYFNDKAIEFYPYFTQHIVGATEDDLELVEKLRKTRNARELVSSLRDYAEDISDHVWYALQTRLTDVLNRRLQVYTSGAFQVDSIADDYEDLLDALNGGNFTDESIANFKQRLHLELKRACILRKHQIDDDEFLDDVQEFYTAAAVVHLPWTSNSIDLMLPEDGTPAMITSELSEDILTACMSLIKRTAHDTKNPVSRRFMVTRDGVVIEIHEGEFGEASVLMSIYKGDNI